SQRDAAALLIDAQHFAGDLLSLLEHFAGMADLARPRHIADVQQPVDPFFQLDERTIVGEVADLAGDDHVDRVLFRDLGPRVLLGLRPAAREPLPLLIDAQDHAVDLVADLHQFAGMADALGPRHLADVHQPFDPRFELDEGAIAHHVDDLSLVDAA